MITSDTCPPFRSMGLIWYQMYGCLKFNGRRLFENDICQGLDYDNQQEILDLSPIKLRY